jgi:hypothetical protein
MRPSGLTGFGATAPNGEQFSRGKIAAFPTSDVAL